MTEEGMSIDEAIKTSNDGLQLSVKEIAKLIVKSAAVEIRDVDGGEEPFVYSTGNRGPGYVMIKGLVGRPEIMKTLIQQLAYILVENEIHFDFIEGNATGGMVPAWILRDVMSRLSRMEYPYCYLRGSRKQGGHGELITGDKNNPLIKQGMKCLVFEELVNYAGTTCNAAETYRDAGYEVTHAATIFHYDNPEANARLKRMGVHLTKLITLPELLALCITEEWFEDDVIKSYKSFLKSPVKWQLDRDLLIPASSLDAAKELGYQMRPHVSSHAIKLGAPEGKVKEGVKYWAKY